MKSIISLVICWQLAIFSNVVMASEVKENKRISNAVLKLIKREMDTNTEYYFPQKYSSSTDSTIGDEIVAANDAILEKLEDSSFNVNEIKEDIMKQISFEEQTQRTEMAYILRRMDSATMGRIFESALKKGVYSEELRIKFENAYTTAEKKDVLLEMASSDLSFVKMTTIKRIGMASRRQLIEELKIANQFFVIKNRNWKEIAIIVLAVALAGFATWGLMSSIQKKYAKKTEDMHDDFDDAETDAEQDYADRTRDLIATYEERERLRNEGYVWQICATEVKQKSASCQFDHSSYSGTETCTTRCLKNPANGDEAMHFTNCSSAFIPNNCFLRNQYDIGNDEGFDDGYDEGYDYAYQRAYNDAYREYYDREYSYGYSRGYDYGYTAGYSDGLSEAEYDDTSVTDEGAKDLNSNEANNARRKGYREGYAYASLLLLGNL